MTTPSSEVDDQPPIDADIVDVPPIRYRSDAWRMGMSFHATLLIGSAAVLLASFVLEVREGAVEAPLAAIPLPGLCTFKRLTGIDCPGCGLTRCFISISHGQLRQAWSFNPAGLFLYIAVVFQVPYRVVQLHRLKRGLYEYDLGWLGVAFLFSAAVVLFLQWAVRVSMSL